MADWRQIQARIRKAKASGDAPAQLAELYERTHDAMVAFELAQWQEKAGDHAEAARWYTAAAERFRRAQWRTKAEEALARLGAPIPAAAPETNGGERPVGEPPAPATETPASAADRLDQPQETLSAETAGEIATEHEGAAGEIQGSAVPASAQGAPAPVRARRRRGRRGGRKRGRSCTGTVRPGDRTTAPEPLPHSPSAARFAAAPSSAPEPWQPAVRREPEVEPAAAPAQAPPRAEPERSFEPAAAPAPRWQGSSRAGEPALASRLALLESQLRRLLACQQASLGDADRAPAGPGVLLLSDSDQVTHYYIEACQTLRIGIGNLLRGGRGSRDGGRLKEIMAENLGIGETRISKYLKENCAVRWLQLDEGAPELAHFAIAVLRPVVNAAA